MAWRHQPLPHNWNTVRRNILARDNYTCQQCGSHQHLEVDHITPAWKTGHDNHHPNNLQTLCHTCHKKKTNKEIAQHNKKYPKLPKHPHKPPQPPQLLTIRNLTHHEPHPHWTTHQPPKTRTR